MLLLNLLIKFINFDENTTLDSSSKSYIWFSNKNIASSSDKNIELLLTPRFIRSGQAIRLNQNYIMYYLSQGIRTICKF